MLFFFRKFIWPIISVILILGCKVEQPVQQASTQETTVVPEDSLLQDTVEVVKEPEIYHGSRTRLHDLIHTKLEISPDWEKQRLNGVATLQLRPYFYPQSRVILDARNFDLHHVKLIKGTKKSDLEYSYDNFKLSIKLDTLYNRKQDFFVEIKYTAKPTERETGGSAAIGSDQGLYFIDPGDSDPNKPPQIWTQGETEANSYWFPTIDSPNEKTTQEIYLTVHQKYQTLSNGELIYSKFNADSTRTDYWRMDLPHAPYLFMIAVGEFEIIEDQWEDVPLYYYLEKEYAEYADDIFGDTPEMMTFFSDITGIKYPWSKYAQIIVRDFVSGAMENTTASLYYDALLVDNRELLDYDFEGIIAHELFHHWFGNLLTCESWANLVLNEGFANYSEYLWEEYKHGKYEADLHNLEETRQYLEEARGEKKKVVRYYYEDREDMFDSHSYAKGGRILHMLRNYVGDDAFFNALNLFLERYKFSTVEIHDMRLVFEEVTGEDLNWFFNQWYLAAGHPVLKINDSYEGNTLTVEVTQEQDFEQVPVFRIPVSVDVWLKKGKRRFTILVDRPSRTFEFTLPEEPQLVLFDGDQHLLAEVDHIKSQGEYIYQFYNTDQFLPRYNSLEVLLKAPADSLNWLVLRDALDDPFWKFRQMAVNALEDYEGQKIHQIEEKLVQIARNDDKSLVRADATHMLFTHFGDNYTHLFEEALNDSSYMVVGTAIYALSSVAPDEMANRASRFEKYNNLNIIIPLASFYIDHGGHSKYGWFVDKIGSAQGELLWYLLPYFSEYIMDAGEIMQRRGLAVIEKYARSHPKSYVRLAAYQALGLLSDLSGVDELMAEIRKDEEDEYLRQIYQSIP